MTTKHDNYEAAAKKIIERVGRKVVIGAPLGIGKTIGLLNALYRMAEADPTLDLTIITALTLARPDYTNELEKRLVAPLLDRMLTNYEDPLYEAARMAQRLPNNVKVIEFFLTTAKYLHNDYVQQNYINSAYTLVVRDALDLGINVIAQLVARSKEPPYLYSVSSNSDLFDDMVTGLLAKQEQGIKIAVVGEVNENMPFMYGQYAVFTADKFTDLIDTQDYKSLFAIPHDELSAADHLIGFYTSFLVRDDSCLQIGIGKLSNSLANTLIIRDKNPAVYQHVFKKLQAEEKFGDLIAALGQLSTFEKGLYASTEMLSDCYTQLYKAGILKKKVYDHIGLQALLNTNKLSENLRPDTLQVLLENKIISANLTKEDVTFLKQFGIFSNDVEFQDGMLFLPSAEKLKADLSIAENLAKISATCLGHQLATGKIVHAGFFLGTNEFYQQLRDLPEDVRHQIDMTSISRTNSVHWCYDLLALQRTHARFVNTAMMVTLGAVVISDGLKNMREVSGVGGQFDFVNMAQYLPNARSIINCHSTRSSHAGVTSNIVWEYPSYTIPRFLRDIVITEYGIADCRGKVDEDIIKNMLNVTDSRFQPELLAQAKSAGKLAKDYEIPELFRQNFPEHTQVLVRELQAQGLCEPYPFGTELTATEQLIKRALLSLKNKKTFAMLITVVRALFFFKSDQDYLPYLDRMQLAKPTTMKEFVYKKLLKFIIHQINHPAIAAQVGIHS
jgi:acyl-CoA hydrolase